MLEVWLEVKNNSILGSHDHWHRVGITWPLHDHYVTMSLQIFDKSINYKSDKSNINQNCDCRLYNYINFS